MKTLYVVRHAKSSWEAEELEDYYRPLKTSGIIDAMRVCEFLRQDSTYVPELIVTSPAIRAYSTALIFAKALDVSESKMMLHEGIYESSKEELYSVVRSLDNRLNKVMLFGHDSSLTDFVNSLSSDNMNKIPTSALVGLHLDVTSWKDLNQDTGKIICYVSPKQVYTKIK